MFLNMPRKTLPNGISRDILGDPLAEQLMPGL